MCSYHFTETSDVSPCSLLCNDTGTDNGEINPCSELSRSVGFSGNCLYCPTGKVLHQESLKHFQSHWVKGHPIIVRNVLSSTTSLCWDPITMFCSYVESTSSESHDEVGVNARNCSDWCEVEIDQKRMFIGSLEKRTHASVRQKVLKFKSRLSSHLFQKQFPTHYKEILSALPLPEYINPVSGLLNVGVKCPKELPMPDLGPSIYFSYGCPGELMQADYLSKLCYQSHDTVNILAYATDAPASPEQINKIESLMKKYNCTRPRITIASSSHLAIPLIRKVNRLCRVETLVSQVYKRMEKIFFPNGSESLPLTSIGQLLKGQPLSVENGILSDDGESDVEA